MELVRLNKYLSEQGICSRREADRRIAEGRVTIDGRIAGMGEKITGMEDIQCDGVNISGIKLPPVLLAVNKPRGVVCTASHKDQAPNVVELIDYPCRVYPVGRLDKDSEGLLLMTNQGDLANRVIHAGNLHEKEYLVKVNRPLTDFFLRKMRSGVELKELGEITRPCQVTAEGETDFRIILTQGLNRQIRRMCESLGYRVIRLRRVRIMNICLGTLKTGSFREVTREEWAELARLTQKAGKM